MISDYYILSPIVAYQKSHSPLNQSRKTHPLNKKTQIPQNIKHSIKFADYDSNNFKAIDNHSKCTHQLMPRWQQTLRMGPCSWTWVWVWGWVWVWRASRTTPISSTSQVTRFRCRADLTACRTRTPWRSLMPRLWWLGGKCNLSTPAGWSAQPFGEGSSFSLCVSCVATGGRTAYTPPMTSICRSIWVWGNFWEAQVSRTSLWLS